MDAQDHERMVKSIAEQFKPVLERSPQAVYLYLDDNHKVCNKVFADLLGYDSPQEWADTDAPLADVLEEDRPAAVRAYRAAAEKFKASKLSLRFHNVKTHRTSKREVIMVPVPFGGEVFVAHFIDKA